jgi:hypothetical protein
MKDTPIGLYVCGERTGNDFGQSITGGKVPLLREHSVIEESLWWTAVRGAHPPEPVPIDIAAQSTT